MEKNKMKEVIKEKDFLKSIYSITENYKNMEASIVKQLKLETPGHWSTTGTYRENVWKDLFERIIPRKFCIDQGVFIIDLKGKISNEVDLAIYDEMYTPYIFNYGKIKFIPIEAVAVAIQCKGDKPKKKDVLDWADSILELETSLNSYCRTMTDMIDNDEDKLKSTQTSTRPILIVCSSGSISYIKDMEQYDIVLQVSKDKSSLEKIIKCEDETLKKWYETLNHAKPAKKPKKEIKDTDRTLKHLKVQESEKENVILSLTLQLNQLLMIINNPMQFPHAAYAEMFNDKIKEYQEMKKRKEEEKKSEKSQKKSNTSNI